jgi:two-component system sensor histidine kinase/response regulator
MLSAHATERRAAQLFADHRRDIHVRTDRLFAGLMLFQWAAGIIFALWISPLAWYGAVSRTHVHVWAAILLGGAVSLFPAILALLRPGEAATRYIIAVAQMLMGALLIHLTGGRLETHFHVFGSLAFLAFYRDWRVLVPATIVVAADHFLRGMFWPQSVYGVLIASKWRWVEHAAWVVFEDVFLLVACRRSVDEMRETALRTAALEQEVRTRQQAENLASLTAAVGLALTRGTAIGPMLQHCADALVNHLEGGLARIWTLNDSGHTLELQAGAGACHALDAAYARVEVGAGAIGTIARRQQPLLARTAAVDLPTCDPAWTARPDVAGFAGFPLLVDSKVVGVLAVFAPDECSASARDAFATIADAVALGIVRDRAEREVVRNTRDLEAARRQAEAATRAKSEFLASMSHELRTPLNAIILYSELLQEEAADRAEPGPIPDLQRIASAGNHLLEVINGILDLSKIEAGKMTLSVETFDVRALVQDLVDTVRPLAEKNQNRFTVEFGGDVGVMHADSLKTRQVLLNLLSNAAKFTSGGAIALAVAVDPADEPPAMVFTVSDTGVGMTPEEMAKIFEPFIQADATTTRKYGGTGLGLTIASRFCSLMGGTIAVDSRAGHGSCFTVRLPRQIVDVDDDVVIAAAVV